MDSESPNQPIDPEATSPPAETVEPVVVASYAEEPAVEENQVAEEQAAEHTLSQADGGVAEAHFDQLLPPQFQNVSAKGGAVAAIVLGCLAVFGAFVTQWSLFNAIIGLPLGLWGLKSNLTRTSVVGICFCLIGVVLCLAMYTN